MKIYDCLPYIIYFEFELDQADYTVVWEKPHLAMVQVSTNPTYDTSSQLGW